MGGISTSQTQSNRVIPFIVDTSFALRVGMGAAWGLYAQMFIRENPVEVFVPSEVKIELDNHYLNRTTQDGVPLLTEKPNIDDLLGIDNHKRYTRLMSTLFGEIDKSDAKLPLSLSPTDLSVAEATFEKARQRQKVAVASSDKDLVDAIREVSLAEGLDVKIFSPWSTSLVDISSKLDLRILITSDVFAELYRSKNPPKSANYLYVAKNLEIRGQGLYDIAFAVLSRNSVTDRLPIFRGVYFIPVISIELRDGKIRSDFMKLLTSRVFAVYDPEYPTTIGLIEDQNPLKPYQVKNILPKGKAIALVVDDIKDALQDGKKALAQSGIEFIKWGRINSHLIRGYDYHAMGTLNYFKEEISARRH